MRNIFFLIVLTVFGLTANAQSLSIKGVLKDKEEKTVVAGATVTLRVPGDSATLKNVVSNQKGEFAFVNLNPGRYQVIASFIGLELKDTLVTLSDKSIDLGELLMEKEADIMDEVVFEMQAPTMRQKEDTLEYSAAAYKVNPDATIEDMVKKMPGITIENGQVKAGGEQIRKVTIDGRDFFGDDATAALRNLPAEIVDKIQVFDRLSDQAQLTGFDDGNSVKAINVVTRANMRNGQFGRVYAGYGTDDKYSAGGNVTMLSGNRRISLVGLTNNINQQNFAMEDLAGVTSNVRRGGPGGGMMGGGGFGGGFGGGMMGGFGGGQGNFMTGTQGGINKANSFGINYNDKWGKKLDVSGSYFFNNNNNSSNSLVNREIFLNNNAKQFYKDDSRSNSESYTHRVNMRFEYKIDSNKTLQVMPSLSFQSGNSNAVSGVIQNTDLNELISQTLNATRSDNSGLNFNNRIQYRQGFAKRGRSISLGLTTGFNNRESESYLDAASLYNKGGINVGDTTSQLTDSETKGRNISANVNYTEPIGQKGQLMVSYNVNFNKNQSDKGVWKLDDLHDSYSLRDTSLSNKFDNNYNTHRGGLTYRVGDRNQSFSVGFDYQYAQLEGQQIFPNAFRIQRSFTNILPNAMVNAKISPRSSIRLFYRASTNAPSINQLQEVINNSNPLSLSTGNPELDQTFGHRVNARYTFTNTSKAINFLANIFFDKTDNYITNATYIAQQDSVLTPSVTLYRGSQLTKPVNMDGNWSLRSFVTFGFPLKFMKSNFNLNGGYGLSKTPGLINNVATMSTNRNFNGGAVIASNISEYIDFTVSYNANYNVVKNSIQPQLNTSYFTQVTSFDLNLLTKKGWLLQNNFRFEGYSGLADGFNQNYAIWNVSAGKKFLKDQKAELKLTVFDLLKQNQSIVRNVTESYIEDSQTQVLRQYFLLTFSYRLRNFGVR